jgi:TetR/AcrR family transcriptional regulator, cholesterol catabolism regulator
MKEKIIQKAAELFVTLGFKSVTMDDIANELGISKKTIYTHFSNKTELVKEVTHYLFDNIACGIDGIRAEEKNPIEELYEIKKYVMLQLKDEKSSPQYQLQKYYPEIYDTLKGKHFEKMHTCTLVNLQRGIAQGLYRENLDIEFVARIYFIGVNGIKDNTLFPLQKFPKAALFEEYLEYHLRGIVTNKGLKTLKKFIKTSVHNA